MVDAIVERMNMMMDTRLKQQDDDNNWKFKHLNQQLETMADTTETHLMTLKANNDETNIKVQQLKDDLLKQSTAPPTSSHNAPRDEVDDDEERARQVITHGFDADTDEAVITTTINSMLTTYNFKDRAENVFAFTDPAKIGVIQFRSKPAKIGFFKKINNEVWRLPNGKPMSVTNNDTFTQRMHDKRLGFIKYHLNDKVKTPLNDIKIVRKQAIVKIGTRVVAKPDDKGDTTLLGEALEVQHEVEESMKAWCSKFGDQGL